MPKKYWLILLLAIVTTCALYWVDDDLPYDSLVTTIGEFLINTTIVFGVFCGVDVIKQKIVRQVRK